MKNLAIVFSLLVLCLNTASAQQNDKVGSESIMHQNRAETTNHSDWKKGMDARKRNTVITYTVLGAVAGGAVGKSVPLLNQVGNNLSDNSREIYHLESATTLKSTVVGVAVGAGVGFMVGKIRAKRRAEGKTKKNGKGRKLIGLLLF